MKTTLFGMILLCFLTSCSTPNELENNSVETVTLKQEVSVQQVNEPLDMILEEVSTDDILNGETIVENIQNSDLSQVEIESLILMREEEKLARDVYLTLYDIWGQRIFSNIAASEQTHTDAVKTLLERYDITDPVVDDTIGVFQSPVMQELYDNLVAKGNISLLDALIVGATIEDLDIYDLQTAATQIDNEDILAVYSNLERGSRNHMRSFMKNITRQGGTYTPQYISQSEFDSIVSSENERGGNAGGNGGLNGGMGNGRNK